MCSYLKEYSSDYRRHASKHTKWRCQHVCMSRQWALCDLEGRWAIVRWPRKYAICHSFRLSECSDGARFSRLIAAMSSHTHTHSRLAWYEQTRAISCHYRLPLACPLCTYTATQQNKNEAATTNSFTRKTDKTFFLWRFSHKSCAQEQSRVIPSVTLAAVFWSLRPPPHIHIIRWWPTPSQRNSFVFCSHLVVVVVASRCVHLFAATTANVLHLSPYYTWQ